MSRIEGEIPLYAAGGAGLHADVKRRVQSNVEYVLAGLQGRDTDTGGARETGRLRARQRVPLADLLSAYRLLFSEVWAGFVEAAHVSDTDPEVLVEIATTIFQLQNAHNDAVIIAFRDESDHLLRTEERERAVLVDALLGGQLSHGRLVELARTLDLPLEGDFIVVAMPAAVGKDPMPGIDAFLAAVGTTSVLRLRPDHLIGLLSLSDRDGSESTLAILNQHARGPIGASPTFHALVRAPWALALARYALEGHSGGHAVAQFQDSPLNLLFASAPEAARDSARLALGDLLEQPPDRRNSYLETLEAWVECGGSTCDAATILHCHRNTVRYRLDRLEELTGRSLSDPRDVAELVAAVRIWSQLLKRDIPD